MPLLEIPTENNVTFLHNSVPNPDHINGMMSAADEVSVK